MKKVLSVLLVALLVTATFSLCVGADSFDDAAVNCGTWVLDNGTYKSGTAANGDNLLNTGIKVESGKHILVSVDVKYDEFQGACGVGLHFSANKNGGIADGMGLLTWTGSDFQQFKTWCWNPAIASADWWNPVDDLLAWNDTTTVYTISAEFVGDGNIIYSIKNNANGKSFILGSPQEKAFDFVFPAEGCVYVNLINLNCAASFSNLIFEDLSISNSTMPLPTFTVSIADEAGDDKIDHLYLNAAISASEERTVGIIFSDTEDSCAYGANPLFIRKAVEGHGRSSVGFIQSGCYGSAVITAENLGGEEGDSVLALYWQDMPTSYGTLYARVFAINEDGTYDYGDITPITLTDGTNISGITV